MQFSMLLVDYKDGSLDCLGNTVIDKDVGRSIYPKCSSTSDSSMNGGTALNA